MPETGTYFGPEPPHPLGQPASAAAQSIQPLSGSFMSFTSQLLGEALSFAAFDRGHGPQQGKIGVIADRTHRPVGHDEVDHMLCRLPKARLHIWSAYRPGEPRSPFHWEAAWATYCHICGQLAALEAY